ncbi:MAG: asparagine synthase-related protein, partial [Opitutales bacterium]
QLLRDSDTNSMAFTLELRTPLVDAKLYEAVAKIQNKDWHYQNGMPKALLVDAVGNLPRAVTHRTKQGFFLPMDSWLKKEKHELQSEYLDQSAYDKLHAQFMSGKVHWTRLWALIVLDRMLAR